MSSTRSLATRRGDIATRIVYPDSAPDARELAGLALLAQREGRNHHHEVHAMTGELLDEIDVSFRLS